jgi:hypothetical protein
MAGDFKSELCIAAARESLLIRRDMDLENPLSGA